MSPRRPRREELAAAIIAPVLVAVAAFVWLGRDASGDESKPAIRLDAAIPVDKRLRAGELANKLKFFVLENPHPEKRAELRLVVNAGSVLEDEDQRGLAHALEHMVFRGTKSFPGHAVDDYLTSIGMRRGSDINATTSPDETVYRITVPTDRIGVVDTALAILADMAHNATFDPAEARQEAGVVMSEWRSRSSASQRLYDERMAMLLAGSSYANHATIGDTAVLRKFDVGAMRRFYDEWYRPELMAIVVVGDVDATEVERLVSRHFAKIPHRADARARPSPTVPPARDPRAAVLNDPESSGSRVGLWYPREPRIVRTVADYRTALVGWLWLRTLNERLEDLSERPGSPILGADVDVESLARSLDADVVSADVVARREPEALALLSAEVARLAKHSLTSQDVRRRAAAILRDRRAADERADNSTTLAEGLVRQYLTGDALIGRDLNYELTRDLLPSITAADVMARAHEESSGRGEALFVTIAPRPDALAAPPSLIALARDAARNPAPPERDSSTTVALLPVLPTAGAIAAEKTIADAKAFDWVLSNGMRVILKPTRFLFDNIELRLVAPGGASLANDADYPSAYRSDGVIANLGLGPLNGTRLDRRLESTSIDLSATVRDDAIELSGSAAPRDLELLFQLLYLHFTAPRSDTIAFRRYQERLATYASGRTASPDAIFADSLWAITAQHHPRAVKNSKQFTDAVALNKALSFWNARASNASGFTLVMTGDFTLDRVRPLIARYLASLPGGTPERPRDVGMRFPAGVTRRQFVGGTAPRARTQLVLSGPFAQTNEASNALAMVRDLAEMTLEDAIRERLGGTYGVTVYHEVSMLPPATYRMIIDFESAPERTDSLVTVAVEELRRLSTDGPTTSQTDKIRAARTRDLDGESESNSYWASELSWHARMGWSLGSIARHQDEAKTLTRDGLRDAAATYLKPSNYVLVTMIPKLRVGPQDASLGIGAGTGGAAGATDLTKGGRSKASAPKVARTRID